MWAITGSTGFIGSHMMRELGVATRSIDRRSLGAWNRETLRRALAGCTGVVHCAAIMHRPETPADEYERFNVGGTQALLDAARDVSLERVIMMGSIKVYGEAPRGIIDEETPMLADAPYAVTKGQGELLVLGSHDLQPLVLRLCPVYGRGDKGNVRTMIRAIRRRRFFLPGDGETRKSVVHVSTVVDAVRAGIERRDVTGVFVIADAPAPSLREIADTIARHLGRPRPRTIPKPILKGAAGLAGGVARRIGIKTAISGELIEKALTPTICDPSKARRELGVACRSDLDRTIPDEIEWLRESGEI
jgi:nucleoside-diphosphate-sugar epimerase